MCYCVFLSWRQVKGRLFCSAKSRQLYDEDIRDYLEADYNEIDFNICTKISPPNLMSKRELRASAQ